MRSGRRRVCTLHGGRGGGVGRGRDGRGVAEGYAPCLGVGYCRKVVFEGLSRGVRGDALACRGHPYMFFIIKRVIRITLLNTGNIDSYDWQIMKLTQMKMKKTLRVW